MSSSYRFLYVFFFCLACSSYAQTSDSTEQRKLNVAFFPALSYAPETSVQFGAVALMVLANTQVSDGMVRESTFSPYAVYTLKNQIIVAARLDLFTKKGNNINTSARFYKFPDLYFGIGNANDPDSFENYTNQFFQWEGQYLRPLSSRLFMGFGWDVHHTRILEREEGGALLAHTVAGADGGSQVGLGPSVRYDSRNNTIYPSAGTLASFRAIVSYVGDFSYATYDANFRKYLSLWNDENILAFQFRTVFSTGTDMPFYKLPQLGGDDRLRGIANASLYRDRQMIYSQVEYRRPLFWRFGMTLFAGVGDVSPAVDAFQPSELKYVGGIGGRVAAIPDKKLNLRADLGFARGGQWAIYIGLSEAF